MASAKKYKIYFELSAQDEIGSFDKAVRDQIAQHIMRMKELPSQDAIILRNVKSELPLYRNRAGDYRIFFSIDSKHKQVVILAIRKRDSDTYDVSRLQSIAGRYSGPHNKQPEQKKKK